MGACHLPPRKENGFARIWKSINSFEIHVVLFRVCFREKKVDLSPFPLQVDRPRLLDDVRAHDQLQVRAEDGEEAPHGGGPRQGGEGE